MAQLVKCLPSKQEDPNLIPQNPWEKNLGWRHRPGGLALGRKRQEDPWVFLASKIGDLQRQSGNPSKEAERERPRKTPCHCFWRGIHTHVCI